MTSTTEPPTRDATTEATLLAEALVAAMVNSRIYAVDHPRVTDSITEVQQRVETICEAGDAESVQLGAFDRMLVFERRPLLGASMGTSRLTERLDGVGSGGLEFDRGVRREELLLLFTTLVGRDPGLADRAAINAHLEVAGCRGARLLPPYTDGVEGGDVTEQTRVELSIQQRVMDLLQDVTVSVCRGGRIDFDPVREHVEALIERLEGHDALRLGLSRHDQYDAFTFGHSLRVAILAMNFARSLTDDRELQIRVGVAALMHDVGKALIPFEILHSDKPLSDDERREMSRHAELGAECLLDHEQADPLAVAAAFGHHRTPDGGGYPRTSHRHPVSMVSAIVKICDIFEALTAARPYKQPMSPIRAYRVMISMGDSLDQRLLRRFLEVTGIYPVGQHVELHDGRVAIVRAQGLDLLRPQVTLLTPEAVDELYAPEPEDLLDLSEIECGCARAILRELTPAEAAAQALGGGDPAPARG